MLPTEDPDPLCTRCGMRQFSDCCCSAVRDPVYRVGPPEFERQLRAASRPTLVNDLREAERIAKERAR
jgi:hypothetical protein